MGFRHLGNLGTLLEWYFSTLEVLGTTYLRDYLSHLGT